MDEQYPGCSEQPLSGLPCVIHPWILSNENIKAIRMKIRSISHGSVSRTAGIRQEVHDENRGTPLNSNAKQGSSPGQA